MARNFSEITPETSGDFEEKRQSVREHNLGWDATLYTLDGDIVEALIIDRSREGVGLSMTSDAGHLHAEQEITLTVKTGSGYFTARGRIGWKRSEATKTLLGIQYIDHVGLSPDNHALDVSDIKIDPACAMRIPASIALRRKYLPFCEQYGQIYVVSLNIDNVSMNAAITRMIKAPVRIWKAADAEALNKALQRVYGDAANQSLHTRATEQAATKTDAGNAAVDLGDELLYAAFVRQASDIHVDPMPKGARIRFRVDGQLETYKQIKTDIYVELSSRLKIMAGLDISEKRAPQDGRFTHTFSGGAKRIDIRVATLPTKYGERLTLRLLAMQTETLTLDKLGFSPVHRGQIETFLRRIQGMMILTGPTGSGKTTTLYAAIRMLLAERQVNIITVEDPIEYEIEGVAQCEVDATSDKVDFAKALRSILRHDPDVVMIGEIRDKETADIAIKAALTGHMVFGTLHTNSAAATVTRLVDMGVEPYLIAAALRLAVAQRLLRRLCKYCRIPRPMSKPEAIYLEHPDLAGQTIYESSGCVYCNHKGYSGRIGLYELLELHSDWARGVAEGESEAQLQKKMRDAGINSLLQDAIDKLIAGETSYYEVMQIASSW